MDGGGEDDHVWTQERLHQGDWDGCCLIHNQKFGLGQLRVVLGSDVLDRLPVVPVNVNPYHSVVKFGVGALQNFIVLMLFIIQGVEAV